MNSNQLAAGAHNHQLTGGLNPSWASPATNLQTYQETIMAQQATILMRLTTLEKSLEHIERVIADAIPKPTPVAVSSPVTVITKQMRDGEAIMRAIRGSAR